VTAPLPRFLLLGGLLFAASRALAPADPTGPAAVPSVILAEEVEALRRSFVVEHARGPTPDELGTLLQARIDDEVLFREALAEGLDEGDPVVQRRLVENVRFLEGAAGDGATQLRQADALGMRRDDPVVRRRLVNQMRLRLAEAARGDGPSVEDLEHERTRRAEALRAPPRLRLQQLYLGPGRLALPVVLGPLSEEMLSRSFGPGFARTVFSLPTGEWSEPVRSLHGLHRVRVAWREEDETPPLASVAAQLRAAWLAERDARAVREALVELRRRHPVVMEAKGGS
jgi:hypothetical protein